MKHRNGCVSAALVAALSVAAHASASSISLAGEWRFRLDPQRSGASQHWEQQPLAAPDRIFLPGSTDQAGYGTKTSGPEKGWLSRPYTYEGPAWYETDVAIPGTWAGKRITIFLERVHWETQIFVDGRAFGTRDSLSVPHTYDLTAGLTPGRHRITLCIDNSYLVDVGHNAHSVTDHTQTNWNGVVGRMELRATDPVWIESVQIVPGVHELALVATVGNATGKPVSGRLNSQPFTISGTEEKVRLTQALPEARWDEFHPDLFDVSIDLTAGPYRDTWRARTGVRELSTRDRQFVLNGRPVFLRGTVECNIFPLTGYPPTDVESWMRIFRIARSYGLNHFRFHSNTPPEAAFVAADRTGFLLQIELPVWTKINNNQKTMDYMRAEGLRILETYGNHPSFAMLGMGNEFTDGFPFLEDLIAQFKRTDSRHLYTFSADHTGRGPSPQSDYYVGQRIGNGPSANHMRIHGSRFDNRNPSTDVDFSQVVERLTVPAVAHELGQWVVFPDYHEIGSYTGVLKPRNLEAFRAQLAERGMADQDKAFQQASGKFAWILYKEEIETALRTPHYGGVQLLQLEDFPGQGEALVGLLDSFWNSKGIMSPEEFREFYSPTVPLLRFTKFAWTNDETFTAGAQIAHYGEKALSNAAAAWAARDDSGREIGRGTLPAANVKAGEVVSLGEIRLPLRGISRASRVRIELSVAGTGARNHWDVWVYPRQADTAVPAGVTIAHAYDETARQALAAGGKVLLLWPPKRESAGTLATHFLPVFWSLSWFKQQPGTLGILCDPRHPALAGFPTESHSNYQWWDVAQNSRAFILDDTPSAFRPIVQAIDDYHRNHKLGAAFETRVGEGKLLVSGFDLESDLEHRPAARQLRASLLAYMSSGGFAPQMAIAPDLLARILQ